MDVPVLDMATLRDASALDDLTRACEDWGFFQLTNHGVSAALLNDALAQSRAFFALPGHLKQRVVRTDANPWGFFDQELTKNTRDWKEIFDFGPADAESGDPRSTVRAVPQWPELEGFKPVMLNAFEALSDLSRSVLAVLARALETSPDALTRGFDRHTSFLRLNYYPRCDDAAEADAPTVPERGRLGIGHHTDAGAVTLVAQDAQAGLQVLHDGVWRTVTPRADALVVNIGDIVQVWSNDRFPAPLHRVLANGNAERFSMAFFFNPSYDTDYAPLASQCAGGAARYRPINWGRFRAGRAAGDYADHGQEIQIADFRITPER